MAATGKFSLANPRISRAGELAAHKTYFRHPRLRQYRHEIASADYPRTQGRLKSMNDQRGRGRRTIIMCKNIAENSRHKHLQRELPVSYSKNLLDPGQLPQVLPGSSYITTDRRKTCCGFYRWAKPVPFCKDGFGYSFLIMTLTNYAMVYAPENRLDHKADQILHRGTKRYR